jgi:hypothetical protein
MSMETGRGGLALHPLTSSNTTFYVFEARRHSNYQQRRTFYWRHTIDCGTGTVQLADALEIASTRALTLTSGTFDAVSYNVTAGSVCRSYNSTKQR